jgi:membrane-associated phospholipid phosphatase
VQGPRRSGGRRIVATCGLAGALLASSLPGATGLALAQEVVGTSPSTASGQQEMAPVDAGDSRAAHEDGRRRLSKLPSNFGRTLVGVFSRDNLLPFVAGVGITGLGSLADDQTSNADSGPDDLGRFGNSFGGAAAGTAALALLAVGRSSDSQPLRDASYDVAVASAVNFLYTTAIKATVDRTRPNSSNDQSFPSGHTSNAFAWATVMERHYGPIVGLPFYTLASIVGISRVTGGYHHLSDVLAGATIGFIIGRTTVRRGDASEGEPSVSLVPTVGPSGQRGLVAVIRF